MDFDIPQHLAEYLDELDEFIEREIRPLERADDNIRFFDHRREDARTDWDRGGLPNEEWEALLAEARRRADEAGHYRYPFPKRYGGRDGTNLGMAVIREHLARKGLGLHCDLQNEHAIVGNNVGLLLMLAYGSDEQQAEWVDDLAAGRRGFAFGITEPAHGSDATHMEIATRDGGEWVITGEKTWNTGIHRAGHDLIFARTSGDAGDGHGITAFLVPTDSDGFEVLEYLWTFNMPTDHGHIRLSGVRVPHSAIFGGEGTGLQVVQHFFNENRIRQAASSLGAAAYRLDRAIAYAQERAPFGKPLATNQGIQFPIVEPRHAVRDAAGPHPQDGLADGHLRRVLGVRQGVDVQLLGEPVVLRGGRPGHAGLRRPRLLRPRAVRAHLPPPPPLPDHRRGRGDPDATGGRLPVRLHVAAGPEGSRIDPWLTPPRPPRRPGATATAGPPGRPARSSPRSPRSPRPMTSCAATWPTPSCSRCCPRWPTPPAT